MAIPDNKDMIIAELRAELKVRNKVNDSKSEQIVRLFQENIDLRQALEELFTAYQTLDEETRPADVLPLELIQDIMPQIEQALKGGE